MTAQTVAVRVVVTSRQDPVHALDVWYRDRVATAERLAAHDLADVERRLRDWRAA